jgi:hypothetical protein
MESRENYFLNAQTNNNIDMSGMKSYRKIIIVNNKKSRISRFTGINYSPSWKTLDLR